ncbi:MAG: DNA-3-methyladenine glycosylase 2 family protein [Saprospiraceae bacterium]|nr:DNA-3-methyladenine glycosylase 2 family protein [Saprospiraceae bacterium]
MTKINESIISHLRKDKILRKIVDLNSPPSRASSNDVYESLLGSIVSQQLSTKAAETIYRRLLALYEDRGAHPEHILQTSHEELRACGLSNQKAMYVKNLAEYFLKVPKDNKYWNKLDDDEIIGRLSSIKGIGKWTVQMTLMFTLNRPDVFPVDDLIIRNSIISYYKLQATGKELHEVLHRVAEKWRPYRSFACFYLWTNKDNLK